jgi:hypothetical protein
MPYTVPAGGGFLHKSAGSIEPRKQQNNRPSLPSLSQSKLIGLKKANYNKLEADGFPAIGAEIKEKWRGRHYRVFTQQSHLNPQAPARAESSNNGF